MDPMTAKAVTRWAMPTLRGGAPSSPSGWPGSVLGPRTRGPRAGIRGRTPATPVPPPRAQVSFPVRIGRERREATVLHRAADGEVVEVLEPVVGEAEQLVDEVVEVAAHPRPA